MKELQKIKNKTRSHFGDIKIKTFKQIKTVPILVMLMTFLLAGLPQYAHATAQVNVLTVDVTPMVSPGGSSFGPQNTMGMALQAVDQGGDFYITEMTPAAFAALTPAELRAYDLIAINNHPDRIAGGIGTNWQQAAGCDNGGRAMLNSHDAPRFHMQAPPGSLFFGNGVPVPALGVEPFGAPALVRQAALWAGGIPGKTGLLIFNDSTGFIAGVGWNNPELSLPASWGITDSLQILGGIGDGGYTLITAAGLANPTYAGLSDVRFDINTISSFSANIGDGSFHSIFATYDATIFTATEVLINSGIPDVGGFAVGSLNSPVGPDGLAISLICDPAPVIVDVDIHPHSDPNSINLCSNGTVPVAILGSEALDVNDIDVTTLKLGDADVKMAGRSGRDMCGLEDVNDDGITDLVCHFTTMQLDLAGGATVAIITGALLDGTPFEGSDAVNIVRSDCD